MAVVLVRLLARHVRLRSPMVRALSAVVPSAALVAVIAASWSSARMPTLLHATTLDEGVILNDQRLEWLRPASMVTIAVLWAGVALVRIALRTGALRRARREVLRDAELAPPHVARLVDRLAAAYRIREPLALVSPRLDGGACLVGTRSPCLVIDQRLLAALDAEELRGVVAHELAHLKRRDNVVALALGVLRDCVFFVPGSTWALRQLHRERELAADEAAVALTRAPAALASGLLKVLERGVAAPMRPATACLLSEGTLVQRVTTLVEAAPAPSRVRVGSEVVLVTAATGAAIVAGFVVPTVTADRTAVQGVLLELRPAAAAIADRVLDGEAAAIDVYRSTRIATVAPDPAVADTPFTIALDSPDDAACFDPRGARCPAPDDAALGLRPRIDTAATPLRLPPQDRLVTRPVVTVGDRVAVSLLHDFAER